MRYIVRYDQRLGDILMSLPACQHLARRGHDVQFFTAPQYRSVFQLVSYVRWTDDCQPREGECLLDLRIFPPRWNDFRTCGLSWRKFVYGLYPEILEAETLPICFDRQIPAADYGLPDDYTLISPFGHSQLKRPSIEWFVETVRKITGHTRNLYILSESPLVNSDFPSVTVTSLAHLPEIIRRAREFFTINSAPSIIASVVRTHYYHVYQPDYDGQDNFEAASQTVLHCW